MHSSDDDSDLDSGSGSEIENTINQSDVTRYLKIFLKSMDESFPPWALKGLCHSYTFMMWRAHVIGESDQYTKRLQFLAKASSEKITKMGKLYTEYKTSMHNAINEKIGLLEKQLLETKDKDKHDAIKTKINKIREEHYRNIKEIERKATARYSSEDKKLLQNAKDLYSFTSTLLVSHNPGPRLGLKTDKKMMLQSDYLELLTVAPPDGVLNNKPYLTKSFSIAFNFKRNELIHTLEKTVQEGDFIRIGSTDHVMFLTRSKGLLKIYDPNSDTGSMNFNSYEKLVKYIEEGFFTDFDEPATYMPLVIDIFEKAEKIPHPRTKPVKLIQHILDARGNNSNINAQAWDGSTTLWIAAKGKSVDIVNELLIRKADPNIPSRDGATPAYIAACSESPSILELLAEAKADLNSTLIKNDFTPIYAATLANDASSIKILAKYGVNVNQINCDDVSLMYLAVSEDNVEAVQALAECKANLNMSSKSMTPAYLAAIANKNEMAQTLIELKADFMMPNKNGVNSLEVAIKKNNWELVSLILTSLDTDSTLNPEMKSFLKFHETELTNAFIHQAKKMDPQKRSEIFQKIVESNNALGIILNQKLSNPITLFAERSDDSKSVGISKIISAFPENVKFKLPKK